MSANCLQLTSKNFDCVIVGTGLTECILSAALSMSGKSVLHLEKNQHYGGFSASLRLDSLNDFLRSCANSKSTGDSAPAFQLGESTNLDAEHVFGTSSLSDVVILNLGDEHDLVRNASVSIDLTPKVLWSRSVAIDTVIRSGISQFLEFKALQNLNFYAEGKLIQVPVCGTLNASLAEKNELLEFITVISNPDEIEQKILTEFAERSFVDYAKQKQISEKVTNLIAYAIAFEPNQLGSTPVNQTTAAVKTSVSRFMGSLGRYGAHSPWLYPSFGCADLCQSFCRSLSGDSTTLALDMHITHISAQNDTNTGVLKVTEIAIGDTKNIKTDYLVGNLENFPELMKPTKPSDQRISRCVVITDRPIKTGEEISMSVVPPNTFGNSHCVYVLQLDEHVSVVPSGKYLLQFWTLGSGKGAQPDLQPIVDSFACIPTKTSESSPDTVDDRNTEPNENRMPNILYCSFWSHVERKVREDIVIPSNMLLLCGVNAEVGADSFFEKARQLFEQICPGEEFLPAMPNSLDIVLGGAS